MAKIESMRALAKLKQLITSNVERWGYEAVARCAELELREEQLRQQELGNLIAMLATPQACPYPFTDVQNRIKELSNVVRAER